jgi:pre-mRNA cleavage complex 2 protein Pcf11
MIKAKGVSNVLTVPVANSIEDVEGPDRAVSIDTRRTWVDPPVKTQVCKIINSVIFNMKSC